MVEILLDDYSFEKAIRQNKVYINKYHGYLLDNQVVRISSTLSAQYIVCRLELTQYHEYVAEFKIIGVNNNA